MTGIMLLGTEAELQTPHATESNMEGMCPDIGLRKIRQGLPKNWFALKLVGKKVRTFTVFRSRA